MLAPDPAARELAAIWSSRLEGDYLALPLPPTERAILFNRFDALDVAFKQQDYNKPIALMLQYFPHQRLSREPYIHVLSLTVPAPSWAVQDACERAIKGELDEKRFAPLPGSLRGLAWHIATPMWVEMRKIARVLSAKPPRPYESAERRKHVAARVLADYRASREAQD